MKNILYMGGFELPDKNAAAHRVINNAKALKKLGYNVFFIGVKRNQKEIISEVKNYEGFYFWNIKKPHNLISWFQYLISIKKEIELINKNNLEINKFILYNYPSLKMLKIMKYAKKNNIEIYSDITERYGLISLKIHDIIKFFDSEFRIRLLNKKTNGNICTSSYLFNLYNNKKCLIPLLVDLSDEKWNISKTQKKRYISYVGSPGKKDNLALIVKYFLKIKEISNTPPLIMVGITEEEFYKSNKELLDYRKKISSFVKFLGRVNHNKAIEIEKESSFTIFFREVNMVSKAGFPTKFVESISCGTPVITNETSDLNKYLIEGKNGFFIDINSEKNAVKKLNYILSLKDEKINDMKEYCRLNNPFDYNNYLNEFKKIFK